MGNLAFVTHFGFPVGCNGGIKCPVGQVDAHKPFQAHLAGQLIGMEPSFAQPLARAFDQLLVLNFKRDDKSRPQRFA